MAICSSPEQLRKAIRVIEGWCQRNGMLLNHKKSDIVVFANRKARNIQWMKPNEKKDGNNLDEKGNPVEEKKRKQGERIEWVPARESFEGIPICSKYKYLGTWLDNKLTVQPQLMHISKKSGHIFAKLYPYLVHASSNGRRDMWATMIRPLFAALFPLMDGDPTAATWNQVLMLWKGTFKRMMLIPKRTSTELINWMIGKELYQMCKEMSKSSTAKWVTRKKKKNLRPTNRSQGQRSSTLSKVVLLYSVSSFVDNTHFCKKCLAKGKKGKLTTSDHLLAAHNIHISSVRRIYKVEVERVIEEERKRAEEKKREQRKTHLVGVRIAIARRLDPILRNYLDIYTMHNL